MRKNKSETHLVPSTSDNGIAIFTVRQGKHRIFSVEFSYNKNKKINPNINHLEMD